jgi:hypothetical protein
MNKDGEYLDYMLALSLAYDDASASDADDDAYTGDGDGVDNDNDDDDDGDGKGDYHNHDHTDVHSDSHNGDDASASDADDDAYTGDSDDGDDDDESIVYVVDDVASVLSFDDNDEDYSAYQPSGKAHCFDDDPDGFEFVFDEISSIDEVTIKYIERCSSIPDLHHILRLLNESKNESPELIESTTNRLATLQHHDEIPTTTTNINNTINKVSETLRLALTPANLRVAIEIYSREHPPNDFGVPDGRDRIPMKKLTKIFGIKKTTPSDQRNRFQEIVNHYCDLDETTINKEGTNISSSINVNRRVLILKTGETVAATSAKKAAMSSTLVSSPDTEPAFHDPSFNALTIASIENCCSIIELHKIIRHLRQSKVGLPDHMKSAMKRLTTLEKAYFYVSSASDDDDYDYDVDSDSDYDCDDNDILDDSDGDNDSCHPKWTKTAHAFHSKSYRREKAYSTTE